MTSLVKYPKTMHLPWSPGITNDDKVLSDVSHLEGAEIVITEKMDGENANCYPDGYTHARSLDSRAHPSRDWVKQFWSSRSYFLEQGLRVCGENLFARHSIPYEDLTSYFMGFSVWRGEYCLPWDETMNIFTYLDITPVPVIYRGQFNEKHVRSLKIRDNQEGYVVRLAAGFFMDDFKISVAKYVRPNHVQTDEHWMNAEIIKNGLRSNHAS